MTRRISLHVDRLVLDGVAFSDKAAFERALKAQIAQALGRADQAGALQGLGSAASIDGGTLANPGDPAALGRHIAARIARGGS
jgi:hypothetical protein